jgi:hypothetical protein
MSSSARNRESRRAGVVLALLLSGFVTSAARADEFDKEPINYGTATPRNVVSRLQERLDAGKVKLAYDEDVGYLRSVLRELRVPVSSQMLVFSKTSLQRERIAPYSPRALYFNDDVFVGYCQNGQVMEVSAADPRLGAVFYTLDQDGDRKPRFRRQTDNCLLCHGSTHTHGVPGHVVRSVFPDARGLPILSAGTTRVDHTTPLEKRWGGWYVTGTHGKQKHLGNLVIPGREVDDAVENTTGLNRTDLKGRFNPAAYLSPHSDIVALMVFEHQADALNLITRANFLTRQALHYEATLNREMKLPPTNRWDSTTVRIKSAGDPLVKYLLFSDEAKLTAPVRGTTSFAEEFSKRGPRDGKGRSLRDLDLERRLFKYPCSYLIYSESFDALPGPVRDYVLRQVWDVLTGKDTSKDFAHLSAADRTAIREILVATKPNLPPYWRGGSPPR